MPVPSPFFFYFTDFCFLLLCSFCTLRNWSSSSGLCFASSLSPPGSPVSVFALWSHFTCAVALSAMPLCFAGFQWSASGHVQCVPYPSHSTADRWQNLTWSVRSQNHIPSHSLCCKPHASCFSFYQNQLSYKEVTHGKMSSAFTHVYHNCHLPFLVISQIVFFSPKELPASFLVI